MSNPVTREELHSALVNAPDGSWWALADDLLAQFTVVHPTHVAVPPTEPATSRRDAQFTINLTTQAAADAVRALMQNREMESAAMILAELGIEESDD